MPKATQTETPPPATAQPQQTKNEQNLFNRSRESQNNGGNADVSSTIKKLGGNPKGSVQELSQRRWDAQEAAKKATEAIKYYEEEIPRLKEKVEYYTQRAQQVKTKRAGQENEGTAEFMKNRIEHVTKEIQKAVKERDRQQRLESAYNQLYQEKLNEKTQSALEVSRKEMEAEKASWRRSKDSALASDDTESDGEGYWFTANGSHIHANGEGEVDAGAEGKMDGQRVEPSASTLENQQEGNRPF